ncbi:MULTISPECIES: hypothetical protein [Bradyrhizobium]|uniref:hypothetical protein n=1 Tax=Bradyrhizobium elkanii TaxID=29448 RepID=UPI00040C7F2F|nr:hypothetical protein [Bradyrhizobium elkanii]
MSDQPTLFDLFEEKSLHNCRRMLDNGDAPTRGQLADILEANADQPLPGWFLALLVESLRGELKRKAGRPKKPAMMLYRFAAAEHEYPTLLAWLRNRQQTAGLKGWSLLQGKDWWTGPPHQRAAKIAVERWRLHVSWKSFLDRISSKK